MTTGRTKKDITYRFLSMIDDLVAKGFCRSKRSFCEAIGEHPQNLSRMKKGDRFPTIEHIATACQKFGYSPTWLILGVGPEKGSAEKTPLEERLTAAEEEIEMLKRHLIKKHATGT